MKNQVVWGDCLEGMKLIPDQSIDLLLTDPPYNAKNIGLDKKTYKNQRMQLPQDEYIKLCQDWFKEAQRIAKNILFTPGISNICYYPQPTWILCWHKPAAVSFNRMGGFNAWEPICFYGKMPKGKRLGQDYLLFNTLNFRKGAEKEHPCPKPLDLWQLLIDKFSEEEAVVLDPFMGSWTTAKAAKVLNRNFIGFELEEDYCKVGEERLRQENLF